MIRIASTASVYILCISGMLEMVERTAPYAGSVALIELPLTGDAVTLRWACPPNGSGDRWHPNHGAELVSRICDRKWLTRHFEA